MPKVGMEPIRRRQLIEATIASIHEDGFGHTTIARISRRAGLSSGIVAHYFDDKAGLLEATMRTLAESLRREAVARLARAPNPAARLMAVIDANFAESQFVPELVSAWMAFWGQVRQSPRLARVQRVYQRRLRSNLLDALKTMVPAAEAERVAVGLAAMIDGLWMNAALGQDAVGRKQARAIARAYLRAELRALGAAPAGEDAAA